MGTLIDLFDGAVRLLLPHLGTECFVTARTEDPRMFVVEVPFAGPRTLLAALQRCQIALSACSVEHRCVMIGAPMHRALKGIFYLALRDTEHARPLVLRHGGTVSLTYRAQTQAASVEHLIPFRGRAGCTIVP